MSKIIRSFSFLYRNERTATRQARAVAVSVRLLSVSSIGTNELQPRRYRAELGEGANFQFPLSERTNCNPTANKQHKQLFALSVSSIGTNELQRGRSII